MSDIPSEGTPKFMQFPRDMSVAQVPCAYALNGSADRVWLWLRYPNQVIAVDFDADAAEHLGRGLIEQAQALAARSNGIEVVESKLLGPDGRPA